MNQPYVSFYGINSIRLQMDGYIQYYKNIYPYINKQMMKLIILFWVCAISVYAQDDGDQNIIEYRETSEDPKIQLLINKEYEARNNVQLDYQHIQSYSFEVGVDTEEFVVKVETDQTIRGVITVYWEREDTYVQAQYEQGQEVNLRIYEDDRKILMNEFFYKKYGFKFDAVKDRRYIFRIYKDGRKKIVLMDLENYMKSGKTETVLVGEHMNVHEIATKKVKDKLRTYLSIVQRNTLMNEDIAWNVQLHTNRFMLYQIIQIILVLAATIAQVYFIKSLLTSSSIV